MRGSWNSGEEWDRVDDLSKVQPADQGDGMATVKLNAAQTRAYQASTARLHSSETDNPTTGADLGAGPGAGRTKPVGNGSSHASA
jgi:Mn-containing catalase